MRQAIMRQAVMGQNAGQQHLPHAPWPPAAVRRRAPEPHLASPARPRGAVAAAASSALALSLALTGCSGTPGPAASSGPQSQAPASPSSTPFASPSSLPSGGDAGTAPGSPDASGGALGGFGSITEACAAVSATVLSVLALPMAAATGQDTAEAEKARTELERLQAKVPAEIKESIDKLKSVADDAGKDLSKFNSEEFDKAIAPIDAWLQSHC
jgi:hypothetical protein